MYERVWCEFEKYDWSWMRYYPGWLDMIEILGNYIVIRSKNIDNLVCQDAGETLSKFW